ncbi:MAG: hypothetical protein DDT19_01051 [Syntrophomonadaceae bacterium]|nr:hypothetical protein [Bacillota bacterium]
MIEQLMNINTLNNYREGWIVRRILELTLRSKVHLFCQDTERRKIFLTKLKAQPEVIVNLYLQEMKENGKEKNIPDSDIISAGEIKNILYEEVKFIQAIYGRS